MRTGNFLSGWATISYVSVVGAEGWGGGGLYSHLYCTIHLPDYIALCTGSCNDCWPSCL
jgi:hypothetical protein